LPTNLVEEADLAEHWPDATHLVGEIEEDRTRFEQSERRAVRPVGVVNFAVGVEREDRGVVVLASRDVDPVRLLGEARFLQHGADLHPIGRRQGRELEPIGVLRQPARKLDN